VLHGLNHYYGIIDHYTNSQHKTKHGQRIDGN
jgi:hypothetical protein